MRVYARDVIVVSLGLLCWSSSASAQEGEAPVARPEASVPERVEPRAEESVKTPQESAREPVARAPSENSPIKKRSAPATSDGAFQVMSPGSIALQIGASSGGCFLGAGAGAGVGLLGSLLVLETTQWGNGDLEDLFIIVAVSLVGYGTGCVAGAAGGAYVVGRERQRGGGLFGSAVGGLIGGGVGIFGFALGPLGTVTVPLGVGLGASVGYGVSRRVRHKLSQKFTPSISVAPAPGGGQVGLTLRF